MTKKWLSLAEVCDELGYSESTVRRMVDANELPAYKHNVHAPMRFKASDVDAVMKPLHTFGIGNPSSAHAKRTKRRCDDE